ncbi:MAG: hypothetical protein R3D55_22160 [Chloroflexota bacterium]
MKRVNGTGVILLFVCLGVMIVFAVVGWSFTWALSAGCVVMSALDGALRLRSDTEGREKWLTSSVGGVFGRMPVWILGIVLLVFVQVGLIEWLNGQG